ncbi:MAG: hypothetical protein V3U71_05205, partial [Cocleimonas sp.]
AGSITYSRGSGFHIGSMRGSRHFKGRIDDVRLYDRVLDSASIAAVSNDGSTGGNEKADQTISFNPPATKTTDDAPFAISASASSALAVSFSSTTPAVCTLNGNTVMILSAGNCTINASQSGNSLYNPAPSVTKTIVIEQGEVVKDDQFISFNPPAIKTVDSEPFDISASATSGLVVSFNATTPAVCTLDGSTVTIVTTGICSITASQSGDDAFNPAGDVSKNIIIEEEDIVPLDDQFISFNPPASVTIGQEPSQLTASSTSGLTVILSSNTPAICTLDSNNNLIVVTTVAGNCSVIATQPGNELFNPAPDVIKTIVVEEAEVEKLDQTINFNLPATKTVGDAPFAISALATSELVVSFSSSTPTTCTVSGSTVTILSAGRCDITASQAGNNEFIAAIDIIGTVLINEPNTDSLRISGSITSTDGSPIGSATIKVFESNILLQTNESNPDSTYSLELTVDNNYVLVIDAEGFSTQAIRLPSINSPIYLLDITMVVLEEDGQIFDYSQPFTATGPSGLTIELQVSSPFNPKDFGGDGTLELKVATLDTSTQTGIDAIPAKPSNVDFLAIANFSFNNSLGEVIHLDRMSTIPRVTMPLTNIAKADGSTLQENDRVLLYSLNESIGAWEQEGFATVISDPSSPTGLSAIGNVPHFSWWFWSPMRAGNESSTHIAKIKINPFYLQSPNSLDHHITIKGRTNADLGFDYERDSFIASDNFIATEDIDTIDASDITRFLPYPKESFTETCFWAEILTASGNTITTPVKCLQTENYSGFPETITLGTNTFYEDFSIIKTNSAWYTDEAGSLLSYDQAEDYCEDLELEGRDNWIVTGFPGAIIGNLGIKVKYDDPFWLNIDTFNRLAIMVDLIQGPAAIDFNVNAGFVASVRCQSLP